MEHDDQPFTVLLVEDDLNDIFLIKRAFKRAAAHDSLHIVTDGDAAVHYLQGTGRYADRKLNPLPKLIVMDLKMPRRTGFEVLEWIRREPNLKRIPVVIVSGSDQPADVNRAYDLGANAYMVKPVEFRAVESLFRAITQYWGVECATPDLEMADAQR